MSIEALSTAFDLRGMTPLEKLVLVYLADGYMDGAGTGRLPSNPAAHLAEFCGSSEAETVDAINGLFSKRILVRVKPPAFLFDDPKDPDASGIWFHFQTNQIGATS